jgi:hypothetical protein
LLDKIVAKGQPPSLKDLNQEQLTSLYATGLLKAGVAAFGDSYIKGMKDVDAQQTYNRLSQDMNIGTPVQSLSDIFRGIDATKFVNTSPVIQSIKTSTAQAFSSLISSATNKVQISFDKDRIRSAIGNINIRLQGNTGATSEAAITEAINQAVPAIIEATIEAVYNSASAKYNF